MQDQIDALRAKVAQLEQELAEERSLRQEFHAGWCAEYETRKRREAELQRAWRDTPVERRHCEAERNTLDGIVIDELATLSWPETYSFPEDVRKALSQAKGWFAALWGGKQKGADLAD